MALAILTNLLRKYNIDKAEMIMEIRIENGVTIIKSGYSTGPKYGCYGISFNPKSNRYRAIQTYKRKKYHLGYSLDIEELIERKKEAEKHVIDDSFLEWYKTLEI